MGFPSASGAKLDSSVSILGNAFSLGHLDSFIKAIGKASYIITRLTNSNFPLYVLLFQMNATHPLKEIHILPDSSNGKDVKNTEICVINP